MGTAVNNHDITNELAIRYGIPAAKAAEIHKAYYDLIRRYLAEGHDVVINGIMAFRHVHRAEHQARNPRTGETFVAPAKTVVRVRNRSALNNWQNVGEINLPPVPDEQAQERLNNLYDRWINPKLVA